MRRNLLQTAGPVWLAALTLSATTLGSTNPISFERGVSARCEIEVGPSDPRVVDEDFGQLLTSGPLDDARTASLTFGAAGTASTAFQESLLTPSLFYAVGGVSGFSNNDGTVFICQASPISSADYRFEVAVATPYHFSGRLDTREGGFAILSLKTAFLGPEIFSEISSGDEVTFDQTGVLPPGTYDLRLETSSYISPGDSMASSFAVRGRLGTLCSGDLDGDRDVDISDLAVLLNEFGRVDVALQGDADADGDVDLSDLALLLGSFGVVCD